VVIAETTFHHHLATSSKEKGAGMMITGVFVTLIDLIDLPEF
jgi:hypothetical protein